MNRLSSLVLALLSVLVVACSAVQPSKPSTVLIDVPVPGDVDDLPWLMAVDALKAEGYTIETVNFSAVDAATVIAMEQGDLDMTSMSNQLAWAAIDKGAPIVTFLDIAENPFIMVAKQDIGTCADLDGKAVVVGSVSSVSRAMSKVHMDENCPDAEPEFLIVRRTSDRLAALLSGEGDAAVVNVQDLVYLDRERPGEFHGLITLAQEFPGLQINSFVMRREFGEQYPDLVEDLIHGVFTVRRSLQDPQVLRQAIIEHLELESDEAVELADIYLNRNTWDVSGEYTLETVQATVSFLQEYGDLPPGLTAEDVVDLSYYEAVLDEIERQ